MFLQPYVLNELTFAWCYRVYFRWRTRRRNPNSLLSSLTSEILKGLIQPYGIHLVELATDAVDVRAVVSLDPNDSVSEAASKLKGRISKWLTVQMSGDAGPHLARGYFALTCGDSTAEAINAYLDRQGEHHGYTHPVIFVRSYPATSESESRVQTDHAITRLRFHVVLATWRRRKVFDEGSAEAVADCWLQLQSHLRVQLDKVSFVPDHVHLALTMHPAVKPAYVVAALMNAGQEILWTQFDRHVIQAGVRRLWQPSAYVGSFGDLTSNAIAAYVARWDRHACE